jgi:hypothetical protein
MQPIAEVLSSKRIEDSTGLRLCLSLMNEIPDVHNPERQFGRKFQRPQEMQRVARWVLAFSGSLSFVAVVQPTDLRHRHDGPHFWRLNRSWQRRVLSERKMRSRPMIVLEIRFERPS